MASGQTTSYQYDASGNLITVGLPAGTQIEYLIDGLDRRIGKKVGGTLIKGFLYQDDLRVIAELDGNNNVLSRFVYAAGPGAPDLMIKAGTTFRIIKDHIGSVRLVVDTTSGAIAQRIDYDEFGRVLSDTSPGFQPFGFAGGLYDADTGLVRFGARDYDAETGRFTSKDPAGMSAGHTNFYAYAGNDAVNLIDPTGEEPALARGNLTEEGRVGTGTSADDPTTQTMTLGNGGIATRKNLDVPLTQRAPSVPGVRRETVKEISQNRELQADLLSVGAPDPTVIPKGDDKKKSKIDCPLATATSNPTRGRVTKGTAEPRGPRLGKANRKPTPTTQPF